MIISGCQKLSRTSRSCGEQQSRAAKDAGQERVFKYNSTNITIQQLIYKITYNTKKLHYYKYAKTYHNYKCYYKKYNNTKEKTLLRQQKTLHDCI